MYLLESEGKCDIFQIRASAERIFGYDSDAFREIDFREEVTICENPL